MKYFKYALGGSVALGLGIVLSLTTVSEAVSAKDPSFVFQDAFEPHISSRISVGRVAAILRDHMDPGQVFRIDALAKHLVDLCRQNQLDPAFVLSLIQVESGFQSYAVSSAGAVGLMQLMPATAVYMARATGESVPSREDLFDPFLNIRLGIRYLIYLQSRYVAHSPYMVLAAYNLGPSRVDQLLSRNRFKPDMTLKYYEAIRRGVPLLRSYAGIGKKV